MSPPKKRKLILKVSYSPRRGFATSWNIKADLHDLSDNSKTPLNHASVTGDHKAVEYWGNQIVSAVLATLGKVAPDIEVELAWYDETTHHQGE